MFKTAAAVIALGTMLSLASSSSTGAQEIGDIPGNPSEAIYGDQIIDLSQSWGGAAACIELGTETRCYDTEAELLQDNPQQRATCSSSTRLYDGTSYGGSVVYFTTTGAYINLSGHGFDNITSSYKIGGCRASFYDGANGGGSVYPGSTSAGTSASSMASGWNNRVSSIYIH